MQLFAGNQYCTQSKSDPAIGCNKKGLLNKISNKEDNGRARTSVEPTGASLRIKGTDLRMNKDDEKNVLE